MLIGRFELRPHPYQGCALPTELYQHILERAAGIEPASSAWKAEVIALYDARILELGYLIFILH